MTKPRSIDAYLATVPADRRAALEKLRRAIHAAVPGAEECIRYAMPAFALGRDVVAGFLATTSGCSYYPFSGTTLETLATAIEGYSHTKSALHFDPKKGVPKGLLRQLVATRLAEIRGKAPAKAKAKAKASPEAKGPPKGKTKSGVTPARFRALALGLEGVTEVPHMERKAFRTSRKIFATLGDDHRVNLVVQPAERRDALLASFPDAIASLGGWTRMGFLAVDLARVDEGLLTELVTDAWHDAQPVPKAPRTKAGPARRAVRSSGATRTRRG